MATRCLSQLLCRASFMRSCAGVTSCLSSVTKVQSYRVLWRHKATQAQEVATMDTAIDVAHTAKDTPVGVAQNNQGVLKQGPGDDKQTLAASEILANLDEEGQKKLQIIKLEHDVLLHMGSDVPEDMTDELWLTVFNCETHTARRKRYRYLWKTEERIKSFERKKEEKRKQKEEVQRFKEANPDLVQTKNTIFFDIRNQTMNKFYYSRIIHAMNFGPTLLIDIGYDEFMSNREVVNVVEQILLALGQNKRSKEPFHFIFCNGDPDGKVLQKMQYARQSTPLEDFPFTVTEKSYLDLYPKERLVYLTPNCRNLLQEYNHDDIYIVGGFVDKVNKGKPISLAKAKEHGIRSAKLPLDHYRTWCKGNNILTIDQVINLMLNIKDTGDWNQAFKHVPRHKLTHHSSRPFTDHED